VDYSVVQTSFNLTVGPLNPGPRLQSISIPILEDNILEQNENFEVQLVVNLPDRVSFGIETAKIIILDNEGKISHGRVLHCYFEDGNTSFTKCGN